MKERTRLLIPLALIAGFLIYCWGTILFTDVAATWRQILALAIYPLLIILYFTKFNLSVIATGMFLLAGTVNLLAITSTIATDSYGIRIGSFDIATPAFQWLFFGLLILYILLNGGKLDRIFRERRKVN